jgi:signal transduction histidine kinase/CheY-like chemotaxis protein
MSRNCEFCGGELQQLADTRDYVWVGCPHCLRIWRESIDASPVTTTQGQPVVRVNPPFLESTAGRYAIAATAIAVAFSIRLALKPLIGNASPFLLFTPAVMAAAWYGGGGPAILAATAGALLGNHYFLRVIGEPGIESWDRIALFLLVSATIASLTTILQTSRRRLAESLWRNQQAWAKAEAANQAKDDFISLVSHELQTPVAVVQGWATAIRQRVLRGDALEVALDSIERNAQIEGRLVQDLLDRARITSGRLRLEPRIISLAEVLRTAVEQVRSAFDHNHVQLATRIRDGQYAMSADPVRLQQVFTNLLSNAAKFTPPGGHVAVEASCTASVATVTVRDDGIGISPDFLPRVFDGFRQDARATTPPMSRGLGLGLSIARHFVERHGGSIRASSDGPGTGATFTVVLPLQPPPATIQDRRSQEVPAGVGALQDRSVLLVEDDEEARMLLTQTLEYYGAHVLPAASAGEAVRMLQQHHPDVLLSDLRMPGEDGFSLIQRLRSQPDPDVASIPAAAITASRLTEDHHHAIAAGYQLELQKPVDPDDLVSAILTLASMLRTPPKRMH